MHSLYTASLLPGGGSNQWSQEELHELGLALCVWGYATRLWEENRFQEVTPARVPEAATLMRQSRENPKVPLGAEIAEVSASITDGLGEDPWELLAVVPGINRTERESICFEAARSVIDAAMKATRYLTPPAQDVFDFEGQARCWRFGFFTRCCEASAD